VSAALDTVQPFETPEGVDLSLVPAGPVPRVLAWGIDLLIRLFTYSALISFFPHFGAFGMGILWISIFLVEWFYPVFFEVLWRGRTPGKMTLNLAVVREDGTPVSWPESVVRNLLRSVDILPGCFGVALVSMMVSSRFQRLGDIAAGTLVVYRAPLSSRNAAGTVDAARATPPPIPLLLAEQRAILDFAERVPALNAERAQELAAIPAPAFGPGGDPVEDLSAMAAWLRGGGSAASASTHPAKAAAT
jgi:uncharacterized RDD family membrane protein YckC